MSHGADVFMCCMSDSVAVGAYWCMVFRACPKFRIEVSLAHGQHMNMCLWAHVVT
eukprot:CAMPEP_0202893156 /NCGR_PEP_ID=MMETSP1392-20130828/2792_1 /ASSEMBLY_ACC=CAM_ASM_000868 /TAXON_ID=225041 /ORGANISM="Chlamydomonas chlamydogama, Strain SAG 11-48b" /LENGTH=54 /DNA_ID=CAMNT_0049577381 /DNA_START=247 /DNA_END=407 /DNA_ORIENTATION=+